MPANLRSRNLIILAVMLVAMALVLAAAWTFRDPLRDAMATADGVRAWLMALGPLAPAGYFLFYVAQTVFAPLPGSFASVLGGYLFGFWWGMLLTLGALFLGVTIAVYLSRRFGRRLLERFIPHEELVRWERKLSLRSPIPWFVLFLFPVPDTAIYMAGLSSLSLRIILPAILVGRGANVALGIAIGNASSVLPAEIVVVQWMVLFLIGAVALRYQRPIRYWVLINARRARRFLRPGTVSARAA